MNQLSYKLSIASALMALSATSFAAPGAGAGAAAAGAAARGAAAGFVARQNVGAGLAAESSAADETPGVAPDAESPAAAPAAATTPQSLCPPKPTLLTGSYIGVQAGYGSYRVNNSINSPGGTTLTSNYPGLASNWTAGALIGYGRTIGSLFYLGGEIFINANNFQQDFSVSSGAGPTVYTNQTLNGPTAGFGLLPGIRFTESTLTFVRLGWNRTIFKTNETITGSDNGGVSNARSGFVFGVGLETLITTNYSVRGEFDHTYYNQYNTYAVYNTVVNPSSNQFMVSFIYHPG